MSPSEQWLRFADMLTDRATSADESNRNNSHAIMGAVIALTGAAADATKMAVLLKAEDLADTMALLAGAGDGPS